MKKHKEHERYAWNNLQRFRPSEAPPTKWLWKNFIPERAITFVIGSTGSHKSTFLLALCGAISRGKRFMGHSTRQRRVLYLDNENPADILATRDFALDIDMEKNSWFALWSINGKKPVPRIDPGHGRTLNGFVKHSYAETGKPLLIVLDHWSTFLKPGDGGERTGETTPILQKLKRLCALGATIVVLAHTTKHDDSTIYGGKDIEAKSDVWHLFRNRKDAGATVIHVHSNLRRYGTNRKFQFRPIVKNNHGGKRDKYGKTSVTGFRLVEDHKQKHTSEVEKMRNLIKKNPEASQRELAELGNKQLNVGRNKLEKMLQKYDGKEWKSQGVKGRKTTYVLL